MSKLYLVPTPIGNLEDITLRALKVLGSADIILAEDTRKTGILLNKYDIEKKVLSHHSHNEHAFAGKLAIRIQAGETMALVSDAGTPGISDPGYLLVRACLELGIEIESLPGPTAFVPALVASGLPCDRFCFEGFLPQKKGRMKRIEALSSEKRTVVFYESPHRLRKSLKQLCEVFGNGRPACLARELTKIHEEYIRGTLSEILSTVNEHEPRGECILIVGGM